MCGQTSSLDPTCAVDLAHDALIVFLLLCAGMNLWVVDQSMAGLACVRGKSPREKKQDKKKGSVATENGSEGAGLLERFSQGKELIPVKARPESQMQIAPTKTGSKGSEGKTKKARKEREKNEKAEQEEQEEQEELPKQRRSTVHQSKSPSAPPARMCQNRAGLRNSLAKR